MIAAVVLLVSLPFLVVTALKAKWGVAALGVLFWPAAVVGAVRLAKPDSWWARRRYDADRRARAAAVLPARRRQTVLAAAVIAPAVAFVFVALKAYRIPTEAIEPTLRPSDRVLALRSFLAGSPDAGEVVAYRLPTNGVARCGFPGTYVHRVSARRAPPGRVFVAGDNPSVSWDSRALGPIPKDAVEARLLFRYWPLDRIGRVE